jgi:FkbM family methyltransferase
VGTVFVRVKGDLAVCVPSSPALLTTYVLLEQEDWFEKEIAFVRKLLRRGMNAIDVGANYGLYALTIARLVGPDGMVWAFEPAKATIACLRRSIERNRLDNVQLLETALSDREGQAALQVDENSELNRLSAEPGARTERVSLTTLDHQRALFNERTIDFIKLDAEGEEARIVQGADRLLAEHSPLIMFELRHGTTVNSGLPQMFTDRGYGLYRLLGPDSILVPAHVGESFDPFELNLFACKPDRADALADTRLLARLPAAALPTLDGRGLALLEQQVFHDAFRPTFAGRADASYYRALDAYAFWRDTAQEPSERCAALAMSLGMLRSLCTATPTTARLSTLARAASEAGRRFLATDVLSRLLGARQPSGLAVSEPFWPPLQRFDGIVPGPAPGAWLLAAAAEAFERQHAYSSCFARENTLGLLDWLQSTPFASPEMERRRQLQRIRAGEQSHLMDAPILRQRRPGNLNPNLWRGRPL